MPKKAIELRFSLLDICVHFGETAQSDFISLNLVQFFFLLC